MNQGSLYPSLFDSRFKDDPSTNYKRNEKLVYREDFTSIVTTILFWRQNIGDI